MPVGSSCAICGAELPGDGEPERGVVAAVAEFAANIGIDAGALCAACASGAVPSPCVRRCSLDEAKARCRGCGRSLEQIQAWSSMSTAERCRVRMRLRNAQADRDGPGLR